MVRQRTLTPLIKVRALVPQPRTFKHQELNSFWCFLLFQDILPRLSRIFISLGE